MKLSDKMRQLRDLLYFGENVSDDQFRAMVKDHMEYTIQLAQAVEKLTETTGELIDLQKKMNDSMERVSNASIRLAKLIQDIAHFVSVPNTPCD